MESVNHDLRGYLSVRPHRCRRLREDEKEKKNLYRRRDFWSEEISYYDNCNLKHEGRDPYRDACYYYNDSNDGRRDDSKKKKNPKRESTVVYFILFYF